jgi:eukaryotic-like serine/threonine-protein kinase
MSNSHRVEAIFHEARNLAGDERPAFLERACANDVGLREQVDELLRANDLVGDFLESSLGSPDVESAPISETPGTRIGPYKLLEQIGEGGFGTVFMAEQEHPVRRRVALKIIKLGMDTRSVVARFEQERQALALMDHPNIARVFDAGATEQGRPYFVMELCIGDSITDYCDKHSLPIAQRLELFVQVCQAVQHAHQKGLIHRDLKPSNVLVSTQDGQPVAKVIDFGIAKATLSKLTEKTLFTAHRTLVGTPEYMSPEQAEGSLDIDTRTDVYALGVMLYELLTGATPFDPQKLRSAAYAEIQRIIREDDPPNPSTRLSQNTDTIGSVAARRQTEPRRLGTIVRGELDWIVMKAMDKNRQRRYESAIGFGQDVQRYLAGEAVVAAPASAMYRFRKVVARNKGTVSAGALVAVALLIGLVAFAWQAKVARTQRDRAVFAEGQARAAEAQSERRAANLQKVSEFQANMLSQIDPTDAGVKLMAGIRRRFAEALKKAKVPHGQADARIVTFDRELSEVNATDSAVELIDLTILTPAMVAVESRFKEQPLVDASLRHSVAAIYRTLGVFNNAARLQAAALAMRRRMLGDADPLTLLSLNNMALVLMDQGNTPEAEKMFREAVDGNTRALGPDNPETLRTMSNLGNLYCEEGKFSEAEPLLRSAVERSRRVHGDDHRDTLIAVNSLATLFAHQGKFGEAEPLWREVYERGTRALGADDPDVLAWTFNLGGLIEQQGRAKEAEPYFRDALEKYRRVRGEEHPTTIRAISGLGANLNRQTRYADAEPLYREALDKARRVLGPVNPDTVDYLGRLGGLLLAAGRFDEAEPYLRETFESQQHTLGESHPTTLSAQGLYARLFSRRGDQARAEVLLRDAWTKSARALGEEHPQTLIQLGDLGYAVLQLNKLEEAEPLNRQLLDVRRRVSGPTHPETLVAQGVYALTLQRQEKFADAEALIRDALEKYRATLGNDHQDTIRTMANLANVLRAQRKFAEAEPLCREAMAAYERTRGKDFRSTTEVRVRLGETLTGLDRFTDAETELLAAQRTIESSPEQYQRARQPSLKALIALYESWDKADPGKGHDAQAADWKTKLEALNAATQPTTK